MAGRNIFVLFIAGNLGDIKNKGIGLFVNKKFIIISVIALILAIGGFFIWRGWEKYVRGGALWETEYMKSEYFKIEETLSGRIVVNKKAGLTANIPEGWIVDSWGDGISFGSPDVKLKEDGSLIFQSIKDGGCVVNIQVIKYGLLESKGPTDAGYIRNMIMGVKSQDNNSENLKYDVLSVNGRDGLRTFYFNGDKITKMFFEIPIGQTLYSFDSGNIFSDKCVEEFNNFIKKVSIK